MALKLLSCEWRKLQVINYAVDPSILLPYLPAYTELDFFNGTCYISLVGFEFLRINAFGLPIPFNSNFPEINLRFYVRSVRRPERRGVVFIREIVGRPLVALLARNLFREHYVSMPLKHDIVLDNKKLTSVYSWHHKRWHSIDCHTATHSVRILPGTEEEFILSKGWGFTKFTKTITNVIEVMHPEWEIYPIHKYSADVDYGELYGEYFAFLNNQKPLSVMFAEGSPVSIRLHLMDRGQKLVSRK